MRPNLSLVFKSNLNLSNHLEETIKTQNSILVFIMTLISLLKFIKEISWEMYSLQCPMISLNRMEFLLSSI